MGGSNPCPTLSRKLWFSNVSVKPNNSVTAVAYMRTQRGNNIQSFSYRGVYWYMRAILSHVLWQVLFAFLADSNWITCKCFFLNFFLDLENLTRTVFFAVWRMWKESVKTLTTAPPSLGESIRFFGHPVVRARTRWDSLRKKENRTNK